MNAIQVRLEILADYKDQKSYEEIKSHKQKIKVSN